MIVEVLKEKPTIPGKLGEQIEVSDTLGCAWQSIGLVRVVSRGEPRGSRCVVRKTREVLKHKAKQDGAAESDVDEVYPPIIVPE